MNNTVIAAGMVVKSMAGHDSGSYYAVMRVENGLRILPTASCARSKDPKRRIRFIYRRH